MGGDVECIIEFRNERTGKDFKRENSKRVETEMGKTKASLPGGGEELCLAPG